MFNNQKNQNTLNRKRKKSNKNFNEFCFVKLILHTPATYQLQ